MALMSMLPVAKHRDSAGVQVACNVAQFWAVSVNGASAASAIHTNSV